MPHILAIMHLVTHNEGAMLKNRELVDARPLGYYWIRERPADQHLEVWAWVDDGANGLGHWFKPGWEFPLYAVAEVVKGPLDVPST